MLSITTDYATSTGDPEPCLKSIAGAGFSHVHWCHQWNTDFAYGPAEIDAIEGWMKEYGLALTDLHASVGPEKNWGSAHEHERAAGVELVTNRIEMASRLGSDVVIMHLPAVGESDDPAAAEAAYWDRMWRSLDELKRPARSAGVRIAIENGRFEMIEKVLARYPADYVGLCYDSGHGNMLPGSSGLDGLERNLERLISVHLHDNDGASDQHRLLYTGTVDWGRLASLLARSPYAKPVSMEVSTRNEPGLDEAGFLASAFETGTRFAGMVEGARSGG